MALSLEKQNNELMRYVKSLCQQDVRATARRLTAHAYKLAFTVVRVCAFIKEQKQAQSSLASVSL